VAKILVADDNSNIQKMVGLALKDQGIEVVAVGNGEAAVRKISDIRPDLVLADVFMPVRNGYEVCRYVKEDASLSHIPVILLVGAFDPLDEQEAQRSGADGVLKKPFVPPDPLISMVKSALLRAGVPLGNAPAAEKGTAGPKRSTADILTPAASSKLVARSAEKLPEAMPEPVEEFPAPPAQLKIAAGSEPLAFGSLLGTSEEEEPVITSKPMINLAEERNWDEEPDEVEEEKEEEEETPQGGWRPSALEEEVQPAAAAPTVVPDWREEAFHGNSPAKGFSKRWSPSLEAPKSVEAAESQAVAVSTIAIKSPEEAPAPFTGDAWAAAMAAGVEEKLAAVKDIPAPVPIAEVMPPVSEHLAQEVPEVAAASQEGPSTEAATPTVEETHPVEPANWAVVPETAWEREAKKASLLASTWDSPKAPDVNETQEVPVYALQTPVAHVEDAPLEEPGFCSCAEKAFESTAPAETPAAESSMDPALGAAIPKSWANAWETPAALKAPASAEQAHGEPLHTAEHQPVAAAAEQPTAAESAQPDMDEIVARVLGKMNPEVLQRVTREILKPVIEAIVRDEINSKKS
jgi:CheY-like chemotaxis protein